MDTSLGIIPYLISTRSQEWIVMLQVSKFMNLHVVICVTSINWLNVVILTQSILRWHFLAAMTTGSGTSYCWCQLFKNSLFSKLCVNKQCSQSRATRLEWHGLSRCVCYVTAYYFDYSCREDLLKLSYLLCSVHNPTCDMRLELSSSVAFSTPLEFIFEEVGGLLWVWSGYPATIASELSDV